jgi:hypothetical protein
VANPLVPRLYQCELEIQEQLSVAEQRITDLGGVVVSEMEERIASIYQTAQEPSESAVAAAQGRPFQSAFQLRQQIRSLETDFRAFQASSTVVHRNVEIVTQKVAHLSELALECWAMD